MKKILMLGFLFLPMKAVAGSPSQVFISSRSLVGVATATISNIAGASYSNYKVIFENVVSTVNASTLYGQISSGSGFNAALYNHRTLSMQVYSIINSTIIVSGSSNDLAWQINGSSQTLGTGLSQKISGEWNIYDVDVSTALKTSTWNYSGVMATGQGITSYGGGELTSQAHFIDGVRIWLSQGFFKSGNMYLYGTRNQ